MTWLEWIGAIFLSGAVFCLIGVAVSTIYKMICVVEEWRVFVKGINRFFNNGTFYHGAGREKVHEILIDEFKRVDSINQRLRYAEVFIRQEQAKKEKKK